MAIQVCPELNFLSELYCSDLANGTLLAEYPSSNSEETILQNRTKFQIHDPFPPPSVSLIKHLGPHHLMCGWGQHLPVTSEIPLPKSLREHWKTTFGESGCPKWQPLPSASDLANATAASQYITLFPHQSVASAAQALDPEINYELHSKTEIEKIACPQADVLDTISPPCVVKLSHGYAGLGNFFIRDVYSESIVLETIERQWPDAKLVINSVIDNIVSDVGVQFYLPRNGEPVWLGFTEQQFDAKLRWCGGKFSANKQQSRLPAFTPFIESTANHLSKQGYFGVVGIDLLENEAGEMFLVDINPRLTGITPCLMASRIFARDHGLTEGIYQASQTFFGSLDELIGLAGKINEANIDTNILVLSAFENKANNTTICHLAVNSRSQESNQSALATLLATQN